MVTMRRFYKARRRWRPVSCNRLNAMLPDQGSFAASEGRLLLLVSAGLLTIAA